MAYGADSRPIAAIVTESDFQYWLDCRDFHRNQHETIIDAGWDCACEFSYFGSPSDDTLRNYFIAIQADEGFEYVG